MIVMAEKEERKFWSPADYGKVLSGHSYWAALAVMDPSDRVDQPDFLQAGWGPDGMRNVLSSLSHNSRVLGKAPVIPASSYQDLSLEIATDAVSK